MIIGRNDERQAIEAFLEGAEAEPLALILEGEPGIGKTTLFLEAISTSQGRGARTLVARPAETETDLPFSALTDLLEPVLPEIEGTLPEPQLRALRSALLREAITSPVDRSALCAAVLAVIRRCAEERPLLLAIDDAQWLDPDSAGVIAFVIRRLASESIGALIARRTGPAVRLSRDLDAAFDRLHGRSVALAPLSEEEIGVVLREQLETAPTRLEVREVHRLSAGNPFYAIELARAMRRGDDRPTGLSIPVPRNLREDLVRQRFGSLSVSAKHTLVMAAALARPTPSLLRKLVVDADEALEAASRAGLVKVTTHAVTFTHPLFRSAIYADASRAERHRTHAAISNVVVDPEERARHLALSAEGPDPEVAGTIERGAEHAAARGALGAAADLFAHAVRLTLPDDVASLARRSRAAGEERSRIGDVEGGIADVRRAVDLTAAGIPRAAALESLGSLERQAGRIIEASRHLEDALAEAGDDPTLVCRIHTALCRTLLSVGDLEGAWAHGKDAARSAETLEGPVAADANEALLEVVLLMGQPGSLAAFRSRREGLDPGDEARVDLGFARVLTWVGDHGVAEERLQTLNAAAIQRGDEIARRSVLTDLADVRRRQERWVEGLVAIEEADELASDARSPAPDPGLRAWLEAALGKVDVAEEHGAQATSAGEGSSLTWLRGRSALGMLALSRDDRDEAHRQLAPAWQRSRAIGMREPGWEPFHGDAVEAFLGHGDDEGAEDLTSWLEERAGALDRPAISAVADRCRGLVSAARGDHEAADVAFHRALDAHAATGGRYQLARTLLTQGSWFRRAGRKRDAREALERAAASFRELGAPLWAERADAEGARIGGRRPSRGFLTEGERRVARLAAAGRSNREIADTLVLSIRTVEGQLSSVYSKLGLRNRTELALFFDHDEAENED